MCKYSVYSPVILMHINFVCLVCTCMSGQLHSPVIFSNAKKAEESDSVFTDGSVRLVEGRGGRGKKGSRGREKRREEKRKERGGREERGSRGAEGEGGDGRVGDREGRKEGEGGRKQREDQ